MRKGLHLYWVLLLILFPFFFAGTLLLSLALHHRVQSGVLHGFDAKLSNLVTLVGVLLDAEKHHNLMPTADPASGAEKIHTSHNGDSGPSVDPATTPFYLRHVDIITHIRRTTGLTYLYTFHMTGENRLAYVLDGSEPEDFSPIGQEDSPPDGAAALIVKSEANLEPVVLPVQNWEAWGLFKSGFGPIVLQDGKAQGMVGADIPVDIITERERQATLATIISVIIGIVLTFLVAIRASRSLVSPIALIRSHLIRLAGGDATTTLQSFRIHEFQQISVVISELKDQQVTLDNAITSGITDHARSMAAGQMEAQDGQTCASRIEKTTPRFLASSRSGTASIGFRALSPSWSAFWWIPPLAGTDQPDTLAASSLDLSLKLSASIILQDPSCVSDVIFHSRTLSLFLFNSESGDLHFHLSPEHNGWMIAPMESPNQTLAGIGSIRIDPAVGWALMLNPESTANPDGIPVLDEFAGIHLSVP